MAVQVDRFASEDKDAFRECLEESYLRNFPADLRGTGRPAFEPTRSTVAREGSRIVGTTTSYELLVEAAEGTQIPGAGISLVSVLPTHRGRGIMNALITEQLRNLTASGTAFAALWASQAGLYTRYGFGLAVPCLDMVVPSQTSFVDPSIGRDVLLEYCSIDDALKIGSLQYEVSSRPGRLVMDAAEWQKRRGSLVSAASGNVKAVRAVDAGGGSSGVVIYSVEAAWVAGEPRGRIEIHDMLAADGAAYAAMWRFLLGQDWVSEIHVDNRPLDEPLLALAANPRSLRTQYRDALFLRILDVGRALEARTYVHDLECVLQVRDPLLGDNDGIWVLTVKEGVAVCVRDSSVSPKVELPIDALSAAFLGGITFSSLAGAGRLRVHDDSALQALDSAFWTPLAPHCPFVF